MERNNPKVTTIDVVAPNNELLDIISHVTFNLKKIKATRHPELTRD